MCVRYGIMIWYDMVWYGMVLEFGQDKLSLHKKEWPLLRGHE